MSVIIDLNVVCLVCLRKANEYHSIYENDSHGPHISIVDKITECSDLNIPNDSTKIPDKVCKSCYDDLQATWRFRQNCKEANSVFQYIQQQDDEPEVLATLELETQRIKLPLGLKIKKMNAISTKSRSNRANTHTPLSVKNVKTAETQQQQQQEEEEEEEAATDEEYDYMTDGQLSSSSQINLEFGDCAVNTDDDRDIESGENIFISEITTEGEEEEVLDENAMSGENTEGMLDHIKTENTEKPKYRQILTLPSPRGRGRPKKSSTSASVLQQTSNLKQAGKFSKTSPKTVTRGRRRSESLNDSRLPKICEICGNSYKYQHALNAHMRRHNNVRPYSCEFCEKSFVACVELQRHMRVHTGHKPYACKFCERRFSDFGSRLKHERTHTGERPYCCATCGKTFAYAHVLSVHIRTHTGEKRFQCDRCGRGFTKKAYLLAHREQHGGKHGCVPKDDDDAKSMLTVDEVMFGEEEFIVEELSEIDLMPKEEMNVEEEEVVQDVEEYANVKTKEDDEEQMAEEHLDEVDDADLVFELR